jgi:hypothetical protein
MAESMIRKHVDLTFARWKAGEGGTLVHDGIAAGLTGAGLAYLESKRKTGLDLAFRGRHVPLDLSVGAIGALVSLGMGGTPKTRETVRKVATTAFGIGAFRATEHYLHAKAGTVPYAHQRLVASAGHHGELGEGDASDIGSDPVLAAAARL